MLPYVQTELRLVPTLLLEIEMTESGLYLLASFFPLVLGGCLIGNYAKSQTLGAGIVLVCEGLIVGMYSAVMMIPH